MRTLALFTAAAADSVTFETVHAGDSHCGCTVDNSATAFQDFIACAATEVKTCNELFVVSEVGTHVLDQSDGDATGLRLKQDYREGAYLSSIFFQTTDKAVPGVVEITLSDRTQITISDCIGDETGYTCSIPNGQYADEEVDVIGVVAEHLNLDPTQPINFTKSYGRWPETCPGRPLEQKMFYTTQSGKTFCDCQVGDAQAADTFSKFAECIAAKEDCKENFSVSNTIEYSPLVADITDFNKVRLTRPFAPGAHVIEVVIPVTGPVVGASVSAAAKVLCFDEFNYSSGDLPRATLLARPCSNTDLESDYLELAVNGGTLNPGYGYFSVTSVVGKFALPCPAH